MGPLAGRYDTGMETIYDVLAFIVSNLRATASEADIDEALALIAQLAPSGDTPAAAKAKS